MNADGSNPTNITFSASWLEKTVAWSPDGDYLAVEGTIGNVMDIFIYDLGNSSSFRMNLVFNIELANWRP